MEVKKDYFTRSKREKRIITIKIYIKEEYLLKYYLESQLKYK